MASVPQKKAKASAPSADLFSPKKTTTDEVALTHTPELVIALCGPIGSPLHSVSNIISDMLRDSFGYTDCKTIRLSELIKKYAYKIEPSRIIPDKPEFEKIQAQIDAGNELRKTYGGSILAELAIHEIRFERENHKMSAQHEIHVPRRVCHILDSIKNQEELDLLKTVYREMLYVVGVFSPLEQREDQLKRKGLDSAQVSKLIDRDSGEESETGQTVRDTFPQCDFFLRMDAGTDSQLTSRVSRFLHLILGTKIITPTSNESAMYAAASAAGNSACLSKQVGAAVMSKEGELLSTGWNDVPKKGGGLYTYNPDEPLGENDKRCWNRDGGKCFNDEEKTLFASDLMEILEGYVPAGKHLEVSHAVRSSKKLKNLIEFSRAIHAEMHAILNAGRVAGDKIVDGKLFVTTYPCHSCARHIIAAGISEIYYIEPYRKSLAIKLHGDAISESETEKDKVRLLLFDGVAPGRYLDLFKVRPDSRKKDGMLIKTPLKESMPRLEKSMQAFPELESMVIRSLTKQKLIASTVLQNEQDNGPGAA